MPKIGKVTHFYDHLSVAIVKLTAPITVGDELHFKGHTTDFKQKADSLQFDHKEIEAGKKGQEVGIKVKDKVREGDAVEK